MSTFEEFFKKDITKKLITLTALVIVLYFTRSVLNLLLLTFIFSYLGAGFQDFIISKINLLQNIKRKYVTVIGFFGLVIIIGILAYRYVPIAINQFRAIITLIEDYIDKGYFTSIQTMFPALENLNLADYSSKGISYLLTWSMDIGRFGINVFLAAIMSFFFIFEQEKILHFARQFKASKAGSVYDTLHYFGKNFLNSFGKVIQTQLIIAVTNTIFSVIALGLLGFGELFGLGIMIFILGLIPVAGVIISLVPLSIMAYYIGGINYILYMIILVAVLHGLEAYVLNPKLMSEKTELPVFITIIVLVLSEHFFGVWGLLLGIPSFIFILDLLNINLSFNKKNKSANK